MPTQATNTTSGNWRARIFSEFHDPTGRQWRVEFIDNDTANGHQDFGLSSSAAPHEVQLTEDGFGLSWDGPTDHLGGAVIPSSCEFTFAIETAALEVFPSVIKNNNDARFGVAVYYNGGGTHWEPWWVGSLNHEAIEYETQDRPYLVTVRASCGLNRLRNIEFKNDGDAYLGKKTLVELLAICVNKIPTANFWNGSDIQLKEAVDLFNEEQVSGGEAWTTTDGAEFPTTMLEQTFVKAEAFAEQNEAREDEFGRRAFYPKDFNSCFDILEHVTNAFGARFVLNGFAFWFFPTNALNWSKTLKVQKWTRTKVASQSIRRELVSGSYVPTATSESVNFKKDIETKHALGMGWTNSYLLPVKRCSITHLNAGQQSVFGNPRNFYIDYPNGGVPVTNFVNNDSVLSEGQTLAIRGTYSTGDLVKEFGATIGGGAYNTYGTDRIGARIILRFKVKVGSLYYGSEYSMDTENTSIDMPTGYNGDFTDPNLDFNEVNLPNPSWSTTEKWFDVVVPWTNSDPAADVETNDGWSRVAGLHIKSTGNNEFEYRVNETQDDGFEHDFDFTTVPLPDTASSYTGVDVKVDRIVITRTGGVRETFPQLENIFQSVAIVNYDHTGAALASYSQSAPEDRVDNFLVGIGSNQEDVDVEYFAEQTENTEYFDLGETLLGVSETEDGIPKADGALYVFGGTQNQTTLLSGEKWHSITDTIDNDDTAAHNLLVVTRETLFTRGKPLSVQRGQIVPKSNSTNTEAPFDFTTVFAHNCSTIGDTEDALVPLNLKFNSGAGVYDLEAALLSRTRLSWEEAEDPRKGPRPSTQGGGGPSPVVVGKNSISTNLVNVLDVNEVTYNKVEAVETDVTNIQTKTDLLTVTGAVDLDTMSTSVTSNTTAIGTNATAIGGNTAAIGGNTTDIATNAADISTNAADISTNVSSISNNAAGIGSNTTLANAANSTANSAASQSATALQATVTNAASITAIETKTDFVTVTRNVNLNTLDDDVGDLNTFVGANPSNPPSSGAKLLVLQASGVVAQLPDGTADQVLTTDGSGAYTFEDASGGTTPSVTPTGSLDASSYDTSTTVTWTASNFDGFTTYIPRVVTSGGAVVATTFSQNRDVVTFTAPSTAGSYTFRVIGATAGLGQSAEASFAFSAITPANFSYIRLRGVDSSGTLSANKIALAEVQLYTSSGQSGTDNPTGTATGNNSQSSGIVNFVISAGYRYSNTYAEWKAFDDIATLSSMWWTLSNRTAADNYIQIQFTDSAKAIGSARIAVHKTYTDATHLELLGSNSGRFTGEETLLHTFANTNVGSGVSNFTYN